MWQRAELRVEVVKYAKYTKPTDKSQGVVSPERPTGLVEGKVGNTLFKFDKDTNNILIINGKSRVIKTFYDARNGLESFKEAMRNHLDVLRAQGH